MLTFGQLLRRDRDTREWTLTRLSEQVGGSANYWGDIENDRRPPPKYDVLLRLIKKLRLDPIVVLEACAYSIRYKKEVTKHVNV